MQPHQRADDIMPTYEYECRKCGHHFDLFQGIKDKPITACPKPRCKGKVRRLLGTGAGIIFKGSGYYQTDYRSEDYKKKAKADAPSGSAAPAATDKGAKSDVVKTTSKTDKTEKN